MLNNTVKYKENMKVTLGKLGWFCYFNYVKSIGLIALWKALRTKFQPMNFIVNLEKPVRVFECKTRCYWCASLPFAGLDFVGFFCFWGLS